MKNERGSSLLTVLLITIIFTVLGLAILSAAIGGAQRTEARKDEVELAAQAAAVMNESIAHLSQELAVNQLFYLTDEKLINIDSYLSPLLQELRGRGMNIKDISSSHYHIQPSQTFTRVYEFSYTAKRKQGEGGERSKTMKRTVFLSPTPSFLRYAVGSGPQGTLLLQGASEINGNVFSHTLLSNNTAMYKDGASTQLNQISSSDTLYPRIFGEVLLKDNLNGLKNFQDASLLNFFDEDSKVIISRDVNDYMEVNFGKTLLQLLTKISGGSVILKESDFQDHNLPFVIEKLIEPCKAALSQHMLNKSSPLNSCTRFTMIEPGLNYRDIENISNQSAKSVLYANLEVSPAGTLSVKNHQAGDYPPLYIKGNLKLHPQAWLIVHGDLEIQPQSGRPIEIDGNILVTGNLRIKGDTVDDRSQPEKTEDDEVQFDSTVYVLGQSEISNTNIKGIDSSQLVLMSRKDLMITRINEFKDIGADTITPLKAFFYTEGKAELYGVGSLFQIDGGIFARDMLTINSIRQNKVARSNRLGSNIVPRNAQQGQQSRFSVTHDLSVLLNQLDALPRVDRYQILLEDPIIE
ncbi:hypothetical protein GJU40_04550 [Bacillus lacus]|uniref:Uncharacterized protein n=1 Tax=Metabacillus lacus TaxID=1983721 RepID=A0A7X2IYG1_9BACI|nr:hypothetical protein [Metabacillus lacus]MRX71443.1 hypothetical protein [Metabacillus lacus]